MGTMNTRKVHQYKRLYMDIAERVAEMSHAQRLKVGAVIVRDGRIISMGWNGMPAGWDNECEQDLWHAASEDVERVTRAEVLHAESNAISKLARSIESGLDAEMYCTHNPCMECAKLIYQSGIKKVYYKTEYRDHGGIGFLNKSIEIEHMIDHREIPNDEAPSIFNGGLSHNEHYGTPTVAASGGD